MPLVSPKTDCPHVADLEIADVDYSKLLTANCNNCDSNTENWICLGCYAPYCSRYVNGHFLKHHEAEKHNIGISLADLSFWCYDCDSYIEHPTLQTKILRPVHKIKFGTYPGEEVGTVDDLADLLQATKLEPEPVEEEDPIKEVAKCIQSEDTKNIIVLTGAGLSTAAGIPDFRTPGTGLYDNLQKYNLPRATAIFEIGFFHENPQPFFELAKDFIGVDYRPTVAHYFIKLLEDKGLLLRNYTQNIDSLELKAGLPRNKLIQCHGSYDTSTCTGKRCGKKFDNMVYVKEHILGDEIKIPKCDQCKEAVVKPDVVLFGESLPEKFAKSYKKDFRACDLLIVIGTSLQVFPVAGLVNLPPQNTYRCLINMERAGPFQNVGGNTGYKDHFIGGDINEGVWKIVDELGWREDLQKLIDAGPVQLI